MFIQRYSNVSDGPTQWQQIKTEKSSIYKWDEGSTYVKNLHSLKVYLMNQKDLKKLKMQDRY